MEKDKRQTVYEVYKLAKAICEKVDRPIVLVCNGEVQHREPRGTEVFEDVW